MFKNHKNNLYNILLTLSRNIFFYKNIKLPDTFETRLYLMFIHFSIMMMVSKSKGKKFSQDAYDFLFYNIEYNLRESGLGDVSVNKKMKEYINLFYSILEKIEMWKSLDKCKKVELIANFINIEDNNNFYADYFDKYQNFVLNNSLKNFTKDILEPKF